MNTNKTSSKDNNNPKPERTGSISTIPDWITETINNGSFRHVDLHTGSNGWASPPGDVFSLRSKSYFKTKQKSPGGDYLLSLVAVDLLTSAAKLDHVMAREDNRVSHALQKSESTNAFVFAVNLQIFSGKDPYNLILYFATEDPIPSSSLLHKLINGQDSFRDERFKIVSRIVKGPWVVRSAASSFGAFVVANKVKCDYHRGSNYFEIDVDFSSSKIMTTLVRFFLGYVASVTVDLGFVVETKTEDESPERLIGGVRICHMELSSAFFVKDDDNFKSTLSR
ncbi:unnamed protein product [Cochlearia groenlandica]